MFVFRARVAERTSKRVNAPVRRRETRTTAEHARMCIYRRRIFIHSTKSIIPAVRCGAAASLWPMLCSGDDIAGEETMDERMVIVRLLIAVDDSWEEFAAALLMFTVSCRSPPGSMDIGCCST